MNRCRLALGVVVFFVSIQTWAQTPTCTEGRIPNFHVASGNSSGFTLEWSHPPGFPTSTQYEIYLEKSMGWCGQETVNLPREIIATVQGTTHSVTFSPPNHILCYGIQLAGCPQFQGEFCWLADTLPPPPAAKPNLISAAATADRVTLQYSHPDERTIGLRVERAVGGGDFQFLQFGLPLCPPGTVHSFVDDGSLGKGAAAFGRRKLPPDANALSRIDAHLAPGTYRYRLAAFTLAGGRVFSDEKTVTLGSGCVPPQVAPQASTPSSNVIVDAAVTVNWTTTENPDRFRIDVSRDMNFATGVRSALAGGRDRSAIIRFPEAGQFFLRVVAVNECGRKEGPPITFNVSPPPPKIAVTAKPSGMLQVIGETGQVTDSYTLTNFGGTSTIIRLNQVGQFFDQSPTIFTLEPGRSQIITLTAIPQSAGNFAGVSIPIGQGVPQGLEVPIRLFAATRPSGDPNARPNTNRVDLAEVEGATPTGSIQFTNTGSGSIKGLLVSNVPWLIPIDEFVNLAPGETGTFRFRVDRAQRARARGSEIGTLQLFYLRGPSGKMRPHSSTPPPGSKATLVTVSDTVKPPVTAAGIPAIAEDEVAFFVPGVGHVQGGAGLFISDVTILNSGSVEDLNDLKVYLTPAGGSGSTAQVATYSQISANQSLSLADVSKAVFNVEGGVGSLQVRAKATSSISVNANIFNTSNPSGTYGTIIPVFRSTGALGANEKLYLTGLRKDANGRTNIYLQETTGQAATAELQYLNAAGGVLSTSQQTVQPFALTFIGDAVSQNGVAAIVTNTSTNGARILAHATPVDQLTGDTWSVADWSRQFGYPTTDSVVIPVAGKLRGANNSDFRTDVAIMNTGSSSASGTLRYYPNGGQAMDQVLNLGPLESRILPDVIGSLFGINTTSVGYLIFTPSSGSFVATSRTYTLEGDGVRTYGTGVPTLASATSLKPGEVRKISGIEDATTSTVLAATPGTYRTNLGIAETLGQATTVRATMRYTAVQGAAAAVGVSSRDIALQPRQLLLANNITSFILGENRALFGELREIQVDFEIVGDTGNVMVFTTSTDNGTNDTALRVE